MIRWLEAFLACRFLFLVATLAELRMALRGSWQILSYAVVAGKGSSCSPT